MKNTQTILFDMDGTITEPREIISPDMINAIECLSKKAKIGIVTGSSIEYINEQLQPGLNQWDKDVLTRLVFYPCNGTKKYEYIEGEGYKETSSSNMIKKLSAKNYNIILAKCLEYQCQVMENYHLPYTGTFLQYRGSLLNWCPVGRSAGLESRAAWVEEDEKNKIRVKFKLLLETFIADSKIKATVALGGSTSFDIYPDGWDKTYVLNHVDEADAWFFGDKCSPGGNDHELFKRLSRKKRGFSVGSPDDTIIKIMNLMNELLVINA